MCVSVDFYHTLTHQIFSFRNWNTRCWSVSRLLKNEDTNIDKYTTTERGIWARSEKNSRPVVYWRSQLARVRSCKVNFSVFSSLYIWIDCPLTERSMWTLQWWFVCVVCWFVSGFAHSWNFWVLFKKLPFKCCLLWGLFFLKKSWRAVLAKLGQQF